MIIDERNIKSWSRLGMRAVFGLACNDLAETNEQLMVLTADVSTSAGLDRFRKLYPEKFLDVGIAEQNMMGIATGFASEGYDVVTTTFAPFQSMRCLEQIRVNLGYMQNKVTMVGLGSGVVFGTLGNTHCCIEDVGILRSIPNIDVVVPCDCTEVVKVLNAAIDQENSVYIRLTGSSMVPVVNKADYPFEIGKANLLKEGIDIALLANGMMVNEALKAAEILENSGCSCKVYNFHTVKPIDKEAINDAQKTKLIVTIEEHNIFGGLGSAVAEVNVLSPNPVRQIIMGINDYFPKPMNYNEILEANNLYADGIVKTVLSSLT